MSTTKVSSAQKRVLKVLAGGPDTFIDRCIPSLLALEHAGMVRSVAVVGFGRTLWAITSRGREALGADAAGEDDHG